MRARDESLERRIKECLSEAHKIIRPEESLAWRGIGWSPYKRKYQHVEGCERSLARAIREIAELRPNLKIIAGQMRHIERELAKISDPLARDQYELRAKVQARIAAEQGTASVVAANNLMDFAEPTVGTLPATTVKSRPWQLARLIYKAATGTRLPEHGLKYQVLEYYNKMVKPSQDQVKEKGRTRSRRRDQRVEMEEVGLVWDIPEDVAKQTEEDIERRRLEWERPKPVRKKSRRP